MPTRNQRQFLPKNILKQMSGIMTMMILITAVVADAASLYEKFFFFFISNGMNHIAIFPLLLLLSYSLSLFLALTHYG